MKKIISLFLALIIVLSLGLTGCYEDEEKNSLDDYIAYVNRYDGGYSSVEVDCPAYFLPSQTFFQEYNYIDGEFLWREDGFLKSITLTNARPEISFLRLTYDETTYYSAKQFMLEKIEPYNNKFYVYNNYIFYENSNFVYLNYGGRNFPKHFTMACYNDQNYTLIFIGLYSGTLAGPSCLADKYLDDVENNWKAFIDEYYGDCYDFSQ